MSEISELFFFSSRLLKYFLMTSLVRLSNDEFILPYQNDNYIMVDVVFKRQKQSSANPKKKCPDKLVDPY